MKLTISTALANCREGRLHPIGVVSPDSLREVASSAEQLGYDALWLNEFGQTEPNVATRFSDPPSYFDPMITIAAAAERTDRIRFMTSTIVLPLREPIMFAKEVATLDHFTGGRLTLGIGRGGGAEEYRSLHGELQSPNRGEMMDEYLSALRLLWTERRASFAGRYAKFADVEQYPKPVQDPLPIYMAGTAAGVYRRIVETGQGWIDTFLQPAAIKSVIEQLRTSMREAGRTDELAISRQFYLSLASTREEAEANYQASLPGVPIPPAPSAPEDREMTIIGSPDEIQGRMQSYVDAGVTEVCAIFYAPDLASTLGQMQLFMEQVAPRLAGA